MCAVVTTPGRHSEEQAGRNPAKCNSADGRKHRHSNTPADSATQNKPRPSRNRERRERLIPDVLAHTPVARRAVG